MITRKTETKEKNDKRRKGKAPMKENYVEVYVRSYCISHYILYRILGNYIVLELQCICKMFIYRN